MKLPEVVTPQSIYNGLSTQKTFWEENCTSVNIKNCGCPNVRKDRDIKNCDKYINFEIYLNFSSLEKMKIIYS